MEGGTFYEIDEYLGPCTNPRKPDIPHSAIRYPVHIIPTAQLTLDSGQREKGEYVPPLGTKVVYDDQIEDVRNRLYFTFINFILITDT